MKILVTGGSGFIGSALIRYVIGSHDDEIVNVDKLTYAVTPAALDEVKDSPRYKFEKADVCDRAAMERIFDQHRPDAIIHLAAESHVDRSIDANLNGTYTLLEVLRKYVLTCSHFRFHEISTDDVYGDLEGIDARAAGRRFRKRAQKNLRGFSQLILENVSLAATEGHLPF